MGLDIYCTVDLGATGDNISGWKIEFREVAAEWGSGWSGSLPPYGNEFEGGVGYQDGSNGWLELIQNVGAVEENGNMVEWRVVGAVIYDNNNKSHFITNFVNIGFDQNAYGEAHITDTGIRVIFKDVNGTILTEGEYPGKFSYLSSPTMAMEVWDVMDYPKDLPGYFYLTAYSTLKGLYNESGNFVSLDTDRELIASCGDSPWLYPLHAIASVRKAKGVDFTQVYCSLSYNTDSPPMPPVDTIYLPKLLQVSFPIPGGGHYMFYLDTRYGGAETPINNVKVYTFAPPNLLGVSLGNDGTILVDFAVLATIDGKTVIDTIVPDQLPGEQPLVVASLPMYALELGEHVLGWSISARTGDEPYTPFRTASVTYQCREKLDPEQGGILLPLILAVAVSAGAILMS